MAGDNQVPTANGLGGRQMWASQRKVAIPVREEHQARKRLVGVMRSGGPGAGCATERMIMLCTQVATKQVRLQ